MYVSFLHCYLTSNRKDHFDCPTLKDIFLFSVYSANPLQTGLPGGRGAGGGGGIKFPRPTCIAPER